MNAPCFDVITIGNVCCDIFVPDHVRPRPGDLVTIPSLTAVSGGNGANTAVTLARLRVPTALAGVLGNDLFGRHLANMLQDAGVDISLLRLLQGRSSPATLVFNDLPTGERSFVHHPGTNTDFKLPPEALTTPTRIFHLAAPELLPGVWPRDAVALARHFRDRGVTVTLDTFAVEDQGDPGRLVREHEDLLRSVDMAFPNESEARLVTGKQDLGDVARRLHELGIKVVAIKCGERGAIVSWSDHQVEVAADRVKAIDTCGAGDNFAAGFLAGHLRGMDPVDSTRLGCALGGLCVSHRGSTTGTEDGARLATILARFGLD